MCAFVVIGANLHMDGFEEHLYFVAVAIAQTQARGLVKNVLLKKRSKASPQRNMLGAHYPECLLRCQCHGRLCVCHPESESLSKRI